MYRFSLACLLSILGLVVEAAFAQDSAVWSGSASRNSISTSLRAPTDWTVGEFDRKTNAWKRETSRNVRWWAKSGSRTYGGPVIAGGRVFVGTNNASGYLKRCPTDVDLGCVLAFRQSDGQFLWQYSAPKLRSGRVHDWPMQGICSTPLVQGNRMWFVDNRARVVCLDTEGFYDGEDDGPDRGVLETVIETETLVERKLSDTIAPIREEHAHEADVVWRLDMMAELGVSPHNMANCSPVAWGDTLFVCTSNGVDESHLTIPARHAPSFIAVDKNSGQVLWSDNSPGENISHGQWSSPAVGELGGVPQVVFGGGDGWLYSFRADTWNKESKQPILLWKFDCNPKETKFLLGGRGTRNTIVAAPVLHEGRVYVAVGDDPEHGEGDGHLWCIDPTRRGDVSSHLAMKQVDGQLIPIPHRRIQAVIREEGEVAVDNPNSAMVWHYGKSDQNGDGKFDFEETMHRTTSNAAIKNGLLIIPDLSGLVHCLDARTGKCHWTVDLQASCWGSPVIVGDKVYLGDEDGDISILPLSSDLQTLPKRSNKAGLKNKEVDLIAAEPLLIIPTGSCVYSTPIVVNEVLYFANNQGVFAITTEK